MKYFVKMFGKTFGPFDEQKICQMYQNNKIEDSTEISRDKVEWIRATDILQPMILNSQNSELPPIPDAPVSESVPNGLFPLPESSVHDVQKTPEMPSLEPVVWFYSADGRTGFGPVTRSRIGELIQQGKLNKNSLVWLQGEGSRYLKTEPQLSDLFDGAESNLFISPSLSSTQSAIQPMPNAAMNANYALQKIFNADVPQTPSVSALPQHRNRIGLGGETPNGYNNLLQDRRSSNKLTSTGGNAIRHSTYVLLALLFGCFGVHDFYAKRTVIGLYELLVGMTGVTIVLILFLIYTLTDSNQNMVTVIASMFCIGEFIWILYEICNVTTDGDGRKMI